MLQCAGTPKKGYASCNALRVTSGTTAFQEEQAAKKGIAPQTVRPNAPADSPTGYGPSDLQSAYGLTSAASASGCGRPSPSSTPTTTRTPSRTWPTPTTVRL
ncbi:hypothetical protein GCM10020367_64730 [Streptomyces sannanensis]|uniref:Uncharacterized protein n=1 Tax=Streptomyces sannanensis TaxID=285536 RepID=A0ABP6S4H0_9ACTN